MNRRGVPINDDAVRINDDSPRINGDAALTFAREPQVPPQRDPRSQSSKIGL